MLSILSHAVPARAVTVQDANPQSALSAGEVCADAQALRRILEGNAAYLLVNGFDYAGALAELCRTTRAPLPLLDLTYRIEAIIGRLQDAHSRVRPPEGVEVPDRRELPFVVRILRGRAVAVGPAEDGLLVAGHPYLVSIEGAPINELLRVAGARFRGHAPHRYLVRAAGEVRSIVSVLHRLGRGVGDSIAVVVADPEGRETTLTLRLGERRPPRPLIRQPTQMLGNIALLRINEMWAREERGGRLQFDMLRGAMESRDVADSNGLIIDVRGNDGGTRDVLEYLAPFFITAPLVYNVAYVVGDARELDERDLFSISDRRLTPGERAAAASFLRGFSPAWQPRGVPFLPEPFAAVIEDRPTSHDYSGKPVVILMNEFSFSATDIFLGALERLPNVTLIGVPSSGGSGRSREFTLPNSSIVVRISTMASFRPDGRLYDGYGIEPDVLVEPTLADVVGDTDSQLDAAIRRLRDVRGRTDQSGGSASPLP